MCLQLFVFLKAIRNKWDLKWDMNIKTNVLVSSHRARAVSGLVPGPDLMPNYRYSSSCVKMSTQNIMLAQNLNVAALRNCETFTNVPCYVLSQQ